MNNAVMCNITAEEVADILLLRLHNVLELSDEELRKITNELMTGLKEDARMYFKRGNWAGYNLPYTAGR